MYFPCVFTFLPPEIAVLHLHLFWKPSSHFSPNTLATYFMAEIETIRWAFPFLYRINHVTCICAHSLPFLLKYPCFLASPSTCVLSPISFWLLKVFALQLFLLHLLSLIKSFPLAYRYALGSSSLIKNSCVGPEIPFSYCSFLCYPSQTKFSQELSKLNVFASPHSIFRQPTPGRFLSPLLCWSCSCPGYQWFRIATTVLASCPFLIQSPNIGHNRFLSIKKHLLLLISRTVRVSGFLPALPIVASRSLSWLLLCFTCRCWSAPALCLGSSPLFLYVSFL